MTSELCSNLIAFINKDKILYIDFKPIRARMLPLLHLQRYQELQQAMKELHDAITVADLEVAALRDSYQQVQQIFASQIATLSADEIAPDSTPRWQSIQTELHKQMRLLETDMMLLQASRSPATSQRRISGVRDRLSTLMQYCQALLQL
jgi:hypothetical protein